MSARLVEPNLLDQLTAYGAADVSACFSCGVCTASCPLVDDDAAFPRRIIRLAQVGLVEDLRGSKELWTCYHCGECSQSCPTQADPAAFMAAARKHAIADYDRTGLARTLSTRPALGWAIVGAIGVFLTLFLWASREVTSKDRLDLFRYLSAELVHWTGLVAMVVVAVFGLMGVVRMGRAVARVEEVTWSMLWAERRRTVRALWQALAVESIGQVRYRTDCESGGNDRAEAWWRRRWFLHAMSVWGFLGLMVATALDWGLDLINLKRTGTHVPIWYPSRLIGTVAGLMLLYGVTMFMVRRWRRDHRSLAESTIFDWVLLVLLWLTGVTGFVIEVALYVPPAPAWGYLVFLVHIAVAIELLLLIPFTKLAHIFYRPIALFFHAWRQGRQVQQGN